MRGRKPIPTHLKLVTGKPGRGINKAEPVPIGDLVDPPDWLTDSQKVCWRRAIGNAPRGLLRLLDSAMLTIWVIAEDLHQKAATALAQGELVSKTPDGYAVQNVHLAIINKQAQIMIKAASELGFSPAARARVFSVKGGDEDAQNPFAKFRS